MIKRIAVILIVLFSFSCSKEPETEVVLYKKGDVMPVLCVLNPDLYLLAADISDLFEEVTGIRPSVKGEYPDDDEVAITIGLLEPKAGDSLAVFTITNPRKNLVAINAIDSDHLYNAHRYFFYNYAGVNQFTISNVKEKVNEIKIPVALEYKHRIAFEYREPYFPDNFKKEFRHKNNTHTLEEEWALWGHNIEKAVKITPEMLATVDEKIYEEQLCFSSPELEEALKKFISSTAKNNEAPDKYMIMPNDNAVVCKCSKCIAAGNTQDNASPAVFLLLNKLAKNFPEQQFFSTAYMTTQKPPDFKLEKNAGVMISTMNFPKGVVIAASNKKSIVDDVFTGWEKVADKIYLWDYAVNFDNYFELYPTMSIMQQNLQFYKSRGVSGVFMQGSEDKYSTLAGLKAYVYAQLLQNTGINLKEHINMYLVNTYPEVGAMLFDYYINAEQLTLESKKPLDIYGGMQAAKDKYLIKSGFDIFYDKLIAKTNALSEDKKKKLEPLLLALTHQKLEIMRTTTDLNDLGYATINDKQNAKFKPVLASVFARLKYLQSRTGINVYNESGATLKEYIKYWESEILNTDYKNLLYGGKVQVLSQLDEDYTDARMLNDGAIGFADYYNNWFIATVSDTLSVKIETPKIIKATQVKINFLNDTRHKIYLPEKVIVTVGNKKHITDIKPRNNEKKPNRYEVVIPVVIAKKEEDVIIDIIKQEDLSNRSIACDEIYFMTTDKK